MHTYKTQILLITLLLASIVAYSQENRTEISVDFRVNSALIEPVYRENKDRLSEITSIFNKIKQDSTIIITQVAFCGSASPEGSYQLNCELARARLEALEDIVRREIDIPDSIITRDDSYISWGFLKEQIIKSSLPQKQSILDIIALKPNFVDYYGGRLIDHRIIKLQELDNGKIWDQLNSLFFERMRNAYVIFVTHKRDTITPIESIVPHTEATAYQIPDIDSVIIPKSQKSITAVEDLTRKLYIKTNTIGLGLAISNIAIEIDMSKHWSFAMFAYYSALNYTTSTIKFRTLAIQPELRYWFKENNQKFFLGAHFGYAQYNIAVNGNYRYQDHDGKSPAPGGGISVGYRMPISKDDKWHIEFALGAGVYGLRYDRFYNVNNGKLIDTNRRTYWGIDNAAVNISYSFDLKKRKQ